MAFDPTNREELFDAIICMYCDFSGFDGDTVDDATKVATIEYLQGLDAATENELISTLVIEHYLSAEARQQGYGFESALEFLNWYDRDLFNTGAA